MVILLDKWINNDYLNKNNIQKLKKTFSVNKHFPYLELKSFFKQDIAVGLLKALSKEEFYFKESDLFKLSQTNDFKSIKEGILKEFRKLLCSKEFIDYMQNITGLKLKSNVIDINGSLYQDTCFLLCHDDRLEGRKIAFILYLSDFKADEGGCLNLFASKNNTPTKIIKKIMPKFNTFAFFEVSSKSFHEVEEVVVDKQRIAIGGWFHGD